MKVFSSVFYSLLCSSTVFASQGVTSISPDYYERPAILKFQIISDFISLDKSMVDSIKIASENNEIARLELTLSKDASQNLMKKVRLKSHQKMAIGDGESIISYVSFLYEEHKEVLLVEMTTTPLIAKKMIKTFSS